MEGYDDGTFRPLDGINRAEFVKILLGSHSPEVKEMDKGDCFTDVGREWYSSYVCEAKSRGILSGYSDGSFKPAQEINLAEALKILVETYDVEVDMSAGTSWYDPYYLHAESEGWLANINPSPDHALTRGEMSQLAYIMFVIEDQAETLVFAEALKTCTPYSGSYMHPFGGVNVNREILGVEGEVCIYVEAVPGADGEIACEYPEYLWGDLALMHERIAGAKEGVGANWSTGGGGSYIVDGVEYDNPMSGEDFDEMCTVSS